jgi:hypothetical protein
VPPRLADDDGVLDGEVTRLALSRGLALTLGDGDEEGEGRDESEALALDDADTRVVTDGLAAADALGELQKVAEREARADGDDVAEDAALSDGGAEKEDAAVALLAKLFDAVNVDDGDVCADDVSVCDEVDAAVPERGGVGDRDGAFVAVADLTALSLDVNEADFD